MELDVTTFPAADAIQSVLALVRERAGQHGVEPRFDAADAPTHITADELRLKQVLLNLISNAVKFTPDGGSVTVRGVDRGPRGAHHRHGHRHRHRRRRPVAHLRLLPAGRAVGVERGGTGLGLTLTRRIVELHGGRMWLESELGVGSTFGLASPAGGRRTATGPAGASRRSATHVPPSSSSRTTRAPRSSSACTSPPPGCGPVVVRTGRGGARGGAGTAPGGRRPGHPPAGHGRLGRAPARSRPTPTSPAPPSSSSPCCPNAAAGSRSAPRTTSSSRSKGGPARRRAARRRRADGPAERPDIVVIDDDPTALELVRATLEPQGWTVTTCSGGAEAIWSSRRPVPRSSSSTCSCPRSTGSRSSTRCTVDPARPPSRSSSSRRRR